MNIPYYVYAGLDHRSKNFMPETKTRFTDLRREWMDAVDQKDQLEQKRQAVGLMPDEEAELIRLGKKARTIDGLINRMKINTVHGSKTTTL